MLCHYWWIKLRVTVSSDNLLQVLQLLRTRSCCPPLRTQYWMSWGEARRRGSVSQTERCRRTSSRSCDDHMNNSRRKGPDAAFSWLSVMSDVNVGDLQHLQIVRMSWLVTFPPDEVRSNVMNMSVCLSVCWLACITWRPYGRSSPLFVHVACGHSLVLLWRHCNTLYTSGFMDDIMFSYYGASGPESSMTLCLEEVRQVAVLVGRQDNYSVWSSSPECGSRVQVCHLQLTCCWLCVMMQEQRPRITTDRISSRQDFTAAATSTDRAWYWNNRQRNHQNVLPHSTGTSQTVCRSRIKRWEILKKN